MSCRSIRKLALCVMLVCACSRAPDTGIADDAGPGAPVPIEYVTLIAGPLEHALRFSANLEAETQVQILARTAGQVVKVLVEEGDTVERNQLLLRIEEAEQSSAVKRTKTELAQGQRNFDQQKKLFSHGVISEDVRRQAEFELERAQIAHADAKRMLQYTMVRATVAGTVTLRQVKLGDFVNPNQHLFDITDFDSIVAKVFVPEKELAAVQPGQSVRLFVPSDPSDPPLGRVALVERIAPVVDARTGTAKVTIRISDTKDLKPGAFVAVELVTAAHPKAVLLPRKALVYDNDEAFAFKMVGEDHVERVRVVPLLEGKEHVEATSGFAVGDRVVVAGQIGLKDKATVSATAAATKSP